MLKDTMSTQETGVQEWRDIPWAKVQREVHALQQRIYRASQKGDKNLVHRLQRLLMSSWSAKCLAVRKVTQDNRGKRTAGIDGVASLEPHERLELVEHLSLDQRPLPVRRVWIPKPGTDEKRPLGIPVMADRALQALVKLALEPEWEALFEPNSYGFRPGRSAHDAVAAIFTSVRHMPKFVLDADIAKCFDRINHEALLKKLDTIPQIERLVRAWLKAGVLDGGTLFPTEDGTPQGGVISPLLANIALHGLEVAVQAAVPKTMPGDRNICWTPTVVRYADDFVVMHRDRDVVEKCKEVASEWLKGMGLELKPSKTRIAHTMNEMDGVTGFHFLGFHVRQFPVGKTHSGKTTKGELLGFKTIIRPSKEKVMLRCREIAEIIRQHRGAAQEALIARLNPIIRGWCNYYRTVVSTKSFQKADDVMYHSLRTWARWRHPNKPMKWIVSRYWRMPLWMFGPKEGVKTLLKHSMVHIQRHVKVQGDKSPFDGDWTYWAARTGYYPGITLWLAKLIKGQGGRCPNCGLSFLPDDVIEVHHKDGNHANNKKSNRVALHGHCHDSEHGPAANSEGSVDEND